MGGPDLFSILQFIHLNINCVGPAYVKLACVLS